MTFIAPPAATKGTDRPLRHVFTCLTVTQFGIYEFIRNEFIRRKEQETPSSFLPPAVRRYLGLDRKEKTQPAYLKDFLENVALLEEELV